jgi:hypothetical protein
VIKNQYILVCVLCAFVLVRWLWLSEVPQDTGDGLAHFFIAQHVWENPSDLLNHWGKPVFTLLAAPWAYFGFFAFVLFNVVVYLATTYVGFLIGKKLAFKSYLILLFPIGLLTSMDYAANILGGMTEVLFGFMVLLSGLLILHKRWLWFALLISFAPFARSEGQLLLPLAFFVLSYYRAWKALPFLLVGFVLYAFIGFIAIGDFWWYFNNNPYQGAETIYGRGSWLHYADYWFVHLGFLGLVLFLVALVFFVINLMRKTLTHDRTLLILYFGIVYFGILLVHAYLWANGKNGALGLTRLAIHGWPGLLLACLIAMEYNFQKMKHQVYSVTLALGSCVWLIHDYPLVYDQPFPRKALADERAILDAADLVQRIVGSDFSHHVYYYHPLFAYQVGVNLHAIDGIFKQQSFFPFDDLYATLNSGDLIVLDSHFAHRDMNFPKEKIALFDEIMIFTPLNQYVHEGNQPAQVQVLGVNKFGTKNESSTKNLLDTELQVASNELYVNLNDVNQSDVSGDFVKFRAQLTRFGDTSETLTYFVVQHGTTGESITFELGKNNSWEFSLPFQQADYYKMFVHNPHGVETKIHIRLDYSPR